MFLRKTSGSKISRFYTVHSVSRNIQLNRWFLLVYSIDTLEEREKASTYRVRALLYSRTYAEHIVVYSIENVVDLLLEAGFSIHFKFITCVCV